MARKKTVPLPQAGLLLVEEEVVAAPREPASAPAMSIGAHMAAGPVPKREEAPAPPRRPDQDGQVIFVAELAVRDQVWSFSAMVLSDGGELLDQSDGHGIVTADGVRNSGWVLAASEAMRTALALDRTVKVELRIPDPQAVGFLRITLPDRERFAKIDPETAALPWPDIFREFLGLTSQCSPRICWAF